MEYIFVNDKKFRVLGLLGRGKGGYSYLVEDCFYNKFVCKQIHHEPCDYYQFGNKLESEINDYKKLKEIGINIPELFDVDVNNERILKEYIEGKTIDRLILDCQMKDIYLNQIIKISAKLKDFGINIDYYPTNFVVKNDILFYIDFECNNYMDEWNFDNWGKKYWSMTPEFISSFKK